MTDRKQTVGENIYRQDKIRTGRLPLSTKVFQGIGSLPGSHKDFAFNSLLLLYYNQILGVSATTVATALAVATVIDAVTDPLVGAFSDRLRSKLGRRHPLMYAGALPLGMMMFLLFSPPAELSETALVGWLFVVVILLHLSFTIFVVPWNAIAMELTSDYAERTEIIAWRLVAGWVGGVAFSFAMYTFIFSASEDYPQGQLNPTNYPIFAIAAASLITFWCLFTTHTTRREVPYLLQPTKPTNFSVTAMLRQVFSVIINPFYFRVVIAFLAFAGAAGFGGVFDTLMNTFFWGLAGEDLRWFGFAILGAAVGIFAAVRLQKRFLKQHILITATSIVMVLAIIKVSLRFLDWVPDNGDPMLVVVLVIQEIIHVTAATAAMTVFPSMVADLSDHQEVRTGERQEGVLASVLGFASKATSSVGLILGGLMLDHFVNMPAGDPAAALDPDVLFRLAIADGIIASLLFLIPIGLLAGYKLSRIDIEDIQTQLSSRRVSQAE
jgi:Na+/melibiose symporter-like transporter